MKFFQIIATIVFGCCFSCVNKKPSEKNNLPLHLANDNQKKPDKDSIIQTDSIDMQLASAKADEYYFDGDSALWVKKNLIGCWFVSHGAVIYMVFKDNGTFEFNDYNDKLKKDEILTGKFDVSAQEDRLTLVYEDRPKQRFSFKQGKYPDSNYYIKNTAGYYFVKGTCE